MITLAANVLGEDPLTQNEPVARRGADYPVAVRGVSSAPMTRVEPRHAIFGRSSEQDGSEVGR